VALPENSAITPPEMDEITVTQPSVSHPGGAQSLNDGSESESDDLEEMDDPQEYSQPEHAGMHPS
jgi:hypothetical protein